MKKKIGKISISILFAVVISLLVINLIPPFAQATKVTSEREILLLLERVQENITLESRGAVGTIYYVESYFGNDSWSGRSWSEAFKTVAVALAASHANIASSPNQQSRNTIYIKGSFEEDFTTLAQKTDIVGVGSLNQHKKPRILGHWVVEAYTEDTYLGCRFYNIEFQDDTGGVLFTVPANHNGLEFHYCTFTASASDTIGLLMTSVHDVVINECSFEKDSGDAIFSTAAIQVASGDITNLLIKNSWISGAVGIDIDCSACLNSRFENNVVYATGISIDDESSDVFVINNRCISGAAKGENVSWDFNVSLAAGNIVTSNNDCNDIPDLGI